MRNRWLVLAGLFAVRTATGFSYQAVGSVSASLVGSLGIDYAQLGVLIGLYDLPGVFLAIPGGLLGKRYGDKRVALLALWLMVCGGLLMGFSSSFVPAAAGRLLGGMGAVLLNVLLAKMVIDCFAGREIVLAMAILVSSWPFGISLALFTLGPLAAISSWQLVMWLAAGICLAALVLMLFVYRPPPLATAPKPARQGTLDLSLREARLVLLAALLWALLNASFGSVLGFAPAFLTSAGYPVAAAGALVSVVAWLLIVSVQVGGFAAERFRRPNLTMLVAFAGAGAVFWLVPFVPDRLPLFVVLGLILGTPVGIIMSLAPAMLRPDNRAAGMGVFYTCYYGAVAGLTALAGLSRDITQRPEAPLLFGGSMMFLAIVILVLFRALRARSLARA